MKNLYNRIKNFFICKRLPVNVSYVVMDGINTPYKKSLADSFTHNKINVYINHSMKTDTVLVGYKGRANISTGYIYAPYQPIYDIYGDLNERKDFDFN